jgi:ankyrin repeat protein
MLLAPAATAETALHDAARDGAVGQIDALVAQYGVAPTDVYFVTPLHAAAEAGRVEAVRALLELGAAVDPVDARGWAPIHYAGAAQRWSAWAAISSPRCSWPRDAVTSRSRRHSSRRVPR